MKRRFAVTHLVNFEVIKLASVQQHEGGNKSKQLSRSTFKMDW